MRIFLSYASEDRAVAESLAVALEQEGHETFFDRTSLPPGEAFHARIREGIEAADLLIFLVSPESVADQSYARTELSLAQQRWRSPSNRVLPVVVRQVPIANVPPYLKAVTLLEPQGNLTAEVLANVTRIRRGPRRRAFLIGGAAAAVVVVGMVLWAGRDDLAHSCYLDARLGSVSEGTAELPVDAVVEVIYDGKSDVFWVASDGVAHIDVGPLTPESQNWIIVVKGSDGNEIGRASVRGCPGSEQVLRFDSGDELRVGPRVS